MFVLESIEEHFLPICNAGGRALASVAWVASLFISCQRGCSNPAGVGTISCILKIHLPELSVGSEREIWRSRSQSGLSQLRPGSDSDTASTARIQPKYSSQILELCFVLLASAMFADVISFLVLLHYEPVSYVS